MPNLPLPGYAPVTFRHKSGFDVHVNASDISHWGRDPEDPNTAIIALRDNWSLPVASPIEGQDVEEYIGKCMLEAKEAITEDVIWVAGQVLASFAHWMKEVESRA